MIRSQTRESRSREQPSKKPTTSPRHMSVVMSSPNKDAKRSSTKVSIPIGVIGQYGTKISNEEIMMLTKYASKLEIGQYKPSDKLDALGEKELFKILFPYVREYKCDYFQISLYSAILCSYLENLLRNTNYFDTNTLEKLKDSNETEVGNFFRLFRSSSEDLSKIDKKKLHTLKGHIKELAKSIEKNIDNLKKGKEPDITNLLWERREVSIVNKQ